MIHDAVTVKLAPEPTPAEPLRTGTTVANRVLQPAISVAITSPTSPTRYAGVRAPQVAQRSPIATTPSTAERRHAEVLAQQAQVHFPPWSAVVLQVGLNETGVQGGGGIVLQLVDRTTHQVYFRMPPEQAMPVVARLTVNGMGSGLFVDSKI
jgi:hypothetical protein